MKSDKFLKWMIFLVLFLIGLFCYVKDHGYCEEDIHSIYEIHEGYEFLGPTVRVDREYLFQYPYVQSKEQCLRKWVNPYEHQWDNPQQKKGYKQQKEWQEAYDSHHFEAVRTYQDAYNRVWFLPNLTLRQIGRDCWVSACAMASTKTPNAALVVAFSTLLSQYGLHCLDEWDYINDKLTWSQYHFEQCAIYSAKIHG